LSVLTLLNGGQQVYPFIELRLSPDVSFRDQTYLVISAKGQVSKTERTGNHRDVRLNHTSHALALQCIEMQSLSKSSELSTIFYSHKNFMTLF